MEVPSRRSCRIGLGGVGVLDVPATSMCVERDGFAFVGGGDMAVGECVLLGAVEATED